MQLDFILHATDDDKRDETRGAETEVTNASQIKYWNKVFLKAEDDELWNVEMKIALDKKKSNRNFKCKQSNTIKFWRAQMRRRQQQYMQNHQHHHNRVGGVLSLCWDLTILWMWLKTRVHVIGIFISGLCRQPNERIERYRSCCCGYELIEL